MATLIACAPFGCTLRIRKNQTFEIQLSPEGISCFRIEFVFT